MKVVKSTQCLFVHVTHYPMWKIIPYLCILACVTRLVGVANSMLRSRLVDRAWNLADDTWRQHPALSNHRRTPSRPHQGASQRHAHTSRSHICEIRAFVGTLGLLWEGKNDIFKGFSDAKCGQLSSHIIKSSDKMWDLKYIHFWYYVWLWKACSWCAMR